MIEIPPITQYLFESSICLAIFYGIYYFLFRKDTFFQFNRIYLLGSSIVSLIIPAIKVHVTQSIDNQPLALSKVMPLLETYNVRYASALEVLENPVLFQFSVGDFISLIYKLGAFLFALKLLSGLFKMYDLIKASKATYKPSYTMLKPKDESYLASSFFSYIFWNDTKDEKSKIIMDHELVHVKQWHSLDVILMELMVVVKWFNPLIYLFRNSLRKTHEYIADKYVSEQLGNKYEYAQFIVNENRDEVPNLSNAMFSFIKERLTMLNAEQSSNWGMLKYLSVVPAFVGLLMLFSFDLSDKLPGDIINPIIKLESKIQDISNKNLISIDQETNWRKQFVWGNTIRINLDEKVLRQKININIRPSMVGDFLDQYPSVTNLEVDLHFYPMYLYQEDGMKQLNFTELLDSISREALLADLKTGNKIEFITEFVFDNKIYKQDITVSMLPFFSNVSVDEKRRHFKWGDIEIDYNKTDTSAIISRFNINEAILLDVNSEITIAHFTRFFPYGASDWPSFDITKDEYKNHLVKKIMILTKESESIPLLAHQEVEIKIMRKFLKRLKSLDLASIHEYKASLDLPGEIEFMPEVTSTGSHEIVQFLKTTVSQLRNSKEIRDWLHLVDSGDLVEFTFLDPEGGNFGLMFVVDDPNKIEYPVKLDAPIKTDFYSNFQIVINRESKSYVRLDTTQADSKRIMHSYKNSESYEIIHIPDFKTKMRVVDRNELAGDIISVAEVSNESLDIDPNKLLEFYPESDNDMFLSWGNMLSMKKVGNFSFKEFERSYSQDFLLTYKDETMPILKYDIVIPMGSGLYNRLQTDSNKYYKIQELLGKVEPVSSIYVDNIVIEKDGKHLLLPYQFSYSFE